MKKKDTIKGTSKTLEVRQEVKAGRLVVPSGQALKNKKGFAMVIALLLVLLIMVYSMDTLEIVINMIKNAGNIEAVNEAYYAAEGAMERGLLINKLHGGPGYEKKCISSDTTCASIDYTDFNGARADWQIIGKATCLRDKPFDEMSCADAKMGAWPQTTFYIPRPGTGNAWNTCDPLRVNYDSNNDGNPDADDPCNWGKLHVGDAISIPLHRVVDPDDSDDTNADTNRDGILNPEELGMQAFTIRVRTPCKDGKSTCDDSERYKLDTSYDTEYPYDGDTLMIWEIVGKCIKNDGSEEEECYLTQIDDTRDGYGKNIDENSEIYADLVNQARTAYADDQYVVLKSEIYNGFPDYGEDNFGFRGEILYFLSNGYGTLASGYSLHTKNANDLSWDWNLRKLHKPFLHLSVIHSLKDDTINNPQNIPYLEYQIIIESSLAVADAYQAVVGEGYSQSFKQSVEAKVGYDVGVLRFVIQN